MVEQIYLTDEVNKIVDSIKKAQGISKEGFVDAILRLSLSDSKKVEQAVMLVKAYGLTGASKIETMSKP
jgi:hypothetical protein